ncbi:killer cell lectin like receptor D1 [Phyllostomus discolor]|uniref:Natural killer cells antigen CD94 n=1 Tax=Phyllostomus discolor TaxID=89673 RepID=A0A834EM80_9CHIR|nr:killer cell lectin like receptor D1 [Phyllostomus discolor]
MAASRTTPWRLISGIIGVMCLVLMATLGILLSNGCGCYSCQEKWIGFQCNCFFISNERKTWAESRDICASRNSSLLQLRNRSEMDFLKFSKTFYWIGLSYSEERRVWLWEDGSALSRDLFSPFPTLNTKHCVLYGTRNSVLDESCQEQNPYICKQQLI